MGAEDKLEVLHHFGTSKGQNNGFEGKKIVVGEKIEMFSTLFRISKRNANEAR